MNTPKHTPGPWTFRFAKWAAEGPTEGFGILGPNDEQHSIAGFNISGGLPVMSEETVQKFHPLPGKYLTHEELEANAKLIAAGPDLLAACNEMIKHLTETDFDVCGTSGEQLNRWKAAVRKATE